MLKAQLEYNTGYAAVNTNPSPTVKQASKPTDISPMGILLDTSPWQNRNLDTVNFSESIDHLVATLYRQHKASAHRPIPLLWWRNLFPLFSAADATQLMYALSRQFRLCTQSNREYCAELPLSLCTFDQLALLKGLGFNQLLLSLSDNKLDDTGSNSATDDNNNYLPLTNVITESELHGFNFRKIMFSIPQSMLNEKKFEGFLSSVIRWNPDRIILQKPTIQQSLTLEPSNHKGQLPINEEYSRLFRQYLQNAGYHAVDNNWFVKQEDELLTAPQQSKQNLSLLGRNSVHVKDIITCGPSDPLAACHSADPR